MRSWLAFAFALWLPATALAETQLVTLKSGEEIYGEVAPGQGVLSITTLTGKKRVVKYADVASVQSLSGSATTGRDERLTVVPSPTSAPAPGSSALGDVDALKSQLMADPEVMQVLLQLAQDPQLMAAVMDPKLQAALRAGDLSALQSDPNLARVADDPRVRALVEKFSHR